MKTRDTIILVLVVAVLLVGGMFAAVKYTGGSLSTAGSSAQPVPSVANAATPTSGVLCPSTLGTTMTLNLRNGGNTSGRETFDAGYLAYQVVDGVESLYASGSDTTSGATSPTAFECGKTYHIRLVSADGDGGDNVIFTDLESKNGKVIDNGKAIEFVASGQAMRLDMVGTQHAILQFKVFDNMNNGFMYNSGEAPQDAADFELTGTNFSSTVANTTSSAIGASGQLDMTIQAESTQPDTQYFDAGGFVAITAPAATWDKATVTLGGVKLGTSSFNSYESRLWGTTYQQVFSVPAGSVIDNQITSVRIAMNALAGVNPAGTDSLTVAFLSNGAAQQTSGNDIVFQGVTDASSPAAIYTAQTVLIAIS